MNQASKVVILIMFLSVLCAVGTFTLLSAIPGMPKVDDRLTGPPIKAEKVVKNEVPEVPTAPESPSTRLQGAKVLRVAMDTGEPPWSGTPPMYSKAASGADDGFDIAVAKVIATALGVAEVQVVHGKYSDLPELLTGTEGKADVLISGYSPDETPGVLWSASYLEYGLCLVVPAKSKVKTTRDLFGEAVGIFDDDAAAAEVKGLVKGYTELVRLEDGYWDQLLSGRFAGFVYDYPYAVAEINRFYAQNPHRKGAFRIAQYNLSDSTYAVGVHESDAALLPAINAAIADWRESAAYAEAVKAWLSSGLAADAPAANVKTVKVAAGDTLSKIAERELGSSARWNELWAVNKDRFPNPHLIEVGDLVALP